MKVMRNFYRAHFLGVEFCFSIAIILIFFGFLHHYNAIELLSKLLYGVRTSLYGTIAAVAGALLGFVITGLSVLMTANSTEPLERLQRSRHYITIFKIFFSTSKFLGVLLLVSLIGLVFDKDVNPILSLTIVTLWAIIIVIFRILRCLWVLEKIVELYIIKR